MAQGTQQAKNTQLERRDQGTSLWDPFSMMNSFRSEMDRLFDNFGFGLAPSFGSASSFDWAPSTEVFKRDNNLVVRADLPGMKKEDVDINIEQNAVTIRGERKSEHEENKEGLYRSERSYGSFFRSIPLPEGTDSEKAKAKFDNGVLEITMPVTEQKSKGKKVDIT
jgi:HSP20 family protein